MHHVSEKNVPTYFFALLVKFEPISIKIGRHGPEETVYETVQNCLLYLKYVLALIHLRKLEVRN